MGDPQTPTLAIAPGALEVPSSLPVAAHVGELLDVIARNQVVVVAGETGSGKSTQLPKLCLRLGFGTTGLIGHTQPRRVAARSIAERIAEETGTALGDLIGYAVRFTDRVGPTTAVKVMTDGILLAEIQRDRMLRRYQVLIIDEAHERSLNVDFLLGYLARLLPQRPDLKLIITSATIDTARFSAHFGGAPVVEVSGRTFPVEVRYRPFGEERDDVRDQVTAVCDAVDELRAEGPGDILVFLSGEREIHDTADAIRGRGLTDMGVDVDVLPLYARLSSAEQHRIFQPHRGRRVVLATNVAETSITVPGVRYVIDAGTARISRYSLRLKVQRLPIERVSQASANQRAGRCGRLGPGICVRLYGEDDFAARPPFTEPEILRTNLAAVILQMTALRIGDVSEFPFLEPPDRRAVRNGYALLDELGALHPEQPGRHRRLTRIGRQLARLPVDPRLGRMVIASEQAGAVREALVIAAALSIADPRERPADRREAADAAHRRFTAESGGSDLIALVRLWDYLRTRQKELSGNQFRKLCSAEFLNYLRVREWADLYSQLRQAAGELGIRHGAVDAHPDRVHQAVLSGLLSHIGLRDGEGREYRGAHGSRFNIAPGTALGKATPRWVMAAELVETTRLWARLVAPVRTEWIEAAAGDLAKRSYGEPAWSAERGGAVVTERVSLYGLPIVSGRSVPLERIDPQLAREMFIRHALVFDEADEAWSARQTFLAANRAFVADLLAGQQRHRRPVEITDDALETFYAERLGDDVFTTRHFERWWRSVRRAEPERLTMTAAALGLDLGEEADGFPTVWVHGDLRLAVTYRFDPGAPDDGATVHIPAEVLNRVDPAPFTWGVPGMRPALVEHLLRNVPKDARRELAPMGESVAAVLAVLPAGRAEPAAGHGDLSTALSAVVAEACGVRVSPAELDLRSAPSHLRVGFSVDDVEGKSLAHGHDLAELRRQVSGTARTALATAVEVDERRGITSWDLGDFAREVRRRSGGHDTVGGAVAGNDVARSDVASDEVAGYEVVGYPALVDDGDSVSVRVFSTPELQHRVMHGGVRRLLLLAAAPGRNTIERSLRSRDRLDILGAGLDLGVVIDDCIIAAADQVIAGPANADPLDADALDADPVDADQQGASTLPWTAMAFDQLVRRARGELAPIAADAARAVAAIAARAGSIRRRLGELHAAALAGAVADVGDQLARLVRPRIATSAGIRRLPDIERYLRAIEYRLDRLGHDVGRDRRLQAEVVALEQRYRRLLDRYERRLPPAALIDFGWQLEELRVATFAQPVGATKGVSLTRLTRALAALDSAAG